MSNVTFALVQEMHDQIPATSSTRVGHFITDAEYVVKAKLSPFVAAWGDATEPGIVQVIIKHLALWTELKALFGSQSEEFHEWIRDARIYPWDLLEQIIEMLEDGSEPMDEFTVKDTNQIRLNTKLFTKIFDLGDVLSQSTHPEDNDIRYGEDT
jgi:hypothetical protein